MSAPGGPVSGRGLAEAERRLLARWGGAPEDLAALVMEIEAAAAREALPSVEEMAAALALTGHCGDAHRLTLGLDLSEHDHDDCLFKGPAREDAEALLAALAAARASDGGR